MKPILIGLGVIFALFVAFMGLGVYVGSTPDGAAKAKERNAIDACDETAKSPTLDPGTQRFTARACEHLRDEYRKKWGYSP